MNRKNDNACVEEGNYCLRIVSLTESKKRVLYRKANANQVLKIPRNIPEDQLNDFILELISDTTILPTSSRKRLMNQRYAQLPKGKRKMLKEAITSRPRYNVADASK